jgi:RNA recognition motif-containing protein
LALNESTLNDRALLIKSSTDFSDTGKLPRPSKQAKEESTASKTQKKGTLNPCPKLFLGNLPFETTKKEVMNCFKPFGEIYELRLGQFPDTGKCKGYIHFIMAYLYPVLHVLQFVQS